uniref:Uncharacterized protein n=1 Tax=Anguilla anguilla TaxID=7936 RepID=A0A0E9PD82_ANGAN
MRSFHSCCVAVYTVTCPTCQVNVFLTIFGHLGCACLA